VLAILPLDAILFDQVEICLVDERRRLQRVALVLASKEPVGLPVQLVLHQRQKLIERLAVAAAPVLQEPAYFV
jgi:hypothetical protein